MSGADAGGHPQDRGEHDGLLAGDRDRVLPLTLDLHELAVAAGTHLELVAV